MTEIISIFFDRNLKLQVQCQERSVHGSDYDLLYCWTDDHWYDLLSLLGERYILSGRYDEISHVFLEYKIFDRQQDIYLPAIVKTGLLKGHRYIESEK